jgi:hypothetical protein
MVKKTECGIKDAVFRYVTQPGTVGRYQQFGGTCHLHLQAFLPSRWGDPVKWSGSQPLPTSAGVLCKSYVGPVAQLYVFFRIQLADGHLKQYLDQCKALNPDERGELLEKSEGIINTHKELALEGQTKVRKLHVMEFSSNIS